MVEPSTIIEKNKNKKIKALSIEEILSAAK